METLFPKTPELPAFVPSETAELEAACEKCAQPIVFARHVRTGKTGPYCLPDAPIPGNVALHNEGGEWVATTVKRGQTSTYVSHFANCPAAAHFRKATP